MTWLISNWEKNTVMWNFGKSEKVHEWQHNPKVKWRVNLDHFKKYNFDQWLIMDKVNILEVVALIGDCMAFPSDPGSVFHIRMNKSISWHFKNSMNFKL